MNEFQGQTLGRQFAMVGEAYIVVFLTLSRLSRESLWLLWIFSKRNVSYVSVVPHHGDFFSEPRNLLQPNSMWLHDLQLECHALKLGLLA